MPLYSMVTFSNIRYSEALKLGEVQDKIMLDIMTTNNLTSDFNLEELKKYCFMLSKKFFYEKK